MSRLLRILLLVVTIVSNGVYGFTISHVTPNSKINLDTSNLLRRNNDIYRWIHEPFTSRINRKRVIQKSSTDTNKESSSSSSDNNEVYKDWSEERKSNLFQFLLRDLQVEGVPLLSVDGANDVATMQAALWTTVAELYEQYRIDSKSNKVCLIFEDIPISAIRAVVDDYLLFKEQNTNYYKTLLPELQFITLSLVGKGIGPAIIIEVDADKKDTSITTSIPIDNGHIEDTFQVTAVLKMFIDRVMKNNEVCPHFASSESTTDNNNNSIVYRTCSNTNDIFHIVSSFWNCICELSVADNNGIESIVLGIPNLAINVARFNIITEFMNRNFRLYRGDSIYEILYFHPQYNRNAIQPTNQPVFGHLPPVSWIQAMMIETQKDLLLDPTTTTTSTDELISVSDYQRRSPVMTICIKQISAMERLVPKDEQGVTLDLNVEIDGITTTVIQVPKSGVRQYVQNLQRLSRVGVASLQAQLDYEMQILQS